jgi:phosphopantothenoylcysteine decarboxylase/phosphopantothenate--cysteine ligase
MTEPGDIAAAVAALASRGAPAGGLLAGRTVMVTAGPTREPMDPVRYITNRSSGKMGYAVAAAAAAEGARVILVSGPVTLPDPRGIEVHRVVTAEQMYETTHAHLDGVDIFIGAAAVSDYRPVTASAQKIKKTDDNDTLTLELVRSPDILASVATRPDAPFTVGFAAETNNVRNYALGKLERKQLDMIVANRVGTDCGFDYDENTLDVYWHGGEQSFPTASKTSLAHDLVRLVARRYGAEQGAGDEPAPAIAGARTAESSKS